MEKEADAYAHQLSDAEGLLEGARHEEREPFNPNLVPKARREKANMLIMIISCERIFFSPMKSIYRSYYCFNQKS